MSKARPKLWAECYQIAGPLLLAPDLYTEGQRERLAQLLLDVLWDPDKYRARVVRNLARMQVKP